MGRIDVEKAIEELTLAEKVALTAGRFSKFSPEHPPRVDCLHHPVAD